MDFLDFVKLIKKKSGTIFTLVLIAIVLTAGISLLFPAKYQAYSRLLVVQNSLDSDPYTLSKSNEYLGNLFSQVVYSGSFYNLVMDSRYDINKDYFSGDYNHQIKLWDETVKTKTLADTGIIKIRVYHPNPYQAQQIALAVNDILMNKNSNYQSGGAIIKINVIDQPLVSAHPVTPNLPQNMTIAFAGGLLFSLFFIYLFPEKKYDVKLMIRSGRQTSDYSHKSKLKNNKHKIKVQYYPDSPSGHPGRSHNLDATDAHKTEEPKDHKEIHYPQSEPEPKNIHYNHKIISEPDNSSQTPFRPHGRIENIL